MLKKENFRDRTPFLNRLLCPSNLINDRPLSIISNVHFYFMDRPISENGHFDRPLWILFNLQEKIKIQNVFSVLLILFT